MLKYSNIGVKDKDILEDVTKMRYFDAMRMTEVHMERCLDVLYAKLQKVKEIPEWGIESPNKQKVYLQPISTVQPKNRGFSQNMDQNYQKQKNIHQTKQLMINDDLNHRSKSSTLQQQLSSKYSGLYLQKN